MRENIGLYRGRRKGSGKWIEGTYYRRNTLEALPPRISEGKFIMTDPIVFDLVTRHIIIPNDFCDFGFDLQLEQYEVDPETIGQYTGVPDKNGKIMYEGDVVKGLLSCGEEILSTVVFKDGAFGLKYMIGNDETFNPFTSMCNVTYEIVEWEGK